MNRSAAFAAALAAVLPASARAQAGPVADDVARAEKELGALEKRLDWVRNEYTVKPDPPEIEALRKRYSDAEIQYLLGEYQNAAALLYDVVDNPAFRSEPAYSDAIYYLADSLYRTESFLEARRYFKESLNLGTQRYFQDCLLRLVELSDKVNDYSGIDQYFEMAQKSGRAVRPEVAYVYAKWIARRPDIPLEERIPRALAAFKAIAPDSPYSPQAQYFLAVLMVQKGAYDEGIEAFKRVIAIEGGGPVVGKIKELANLGIGRIYYENGKFDQAIDAYQQINRDSAYYNDSLFEISATYLKKGEFEKALRATELLLVVSEDSPIAPDAKILEGNLYLKLGKHPRATDTFKQVVDEFEPARDRVAETLSRRADPIAYFNELFQQGEKLDVQQLLPPLARKFTDTQSEVAQAQAIVKELEAGKAGIAESLRIVEKLLSAVSEGNLNIFPTLQDGNARAIEVENSLLRVERDLTTAQEKVLGNEAAPEVKQELERLRAARAQIDEAFKRLPKSEAEYRRRRGRYLEKIAELEKIAFLQGLEIEGSTAVLTAIEKWVNDTRDQRATDPKEEREFMERLTREKQAVQILEQERESVLRDVAAQRVSAGSAAAGTRAEEPLRAQLRETLEKERRILERAAQGMSAGQADLLRRIADGRARIGLMRETVGDVRRRIEERAMQKSDLFRQRVVVEKAVLEDYQKTAGAVEGDTRTLVGMIAVQSFQRVWKLFYEFVLKADVGMVDVAWSRKREKTDRIFSLAKDKEREIKVLQDEFKEVLQEIE